MTPNAPPPRPVVWLSLAVLVASVAMSFAGAWRTGVAWDETYHVMRMNNYERTGWFSLDRDFAGPGPTGERKTTYVYGPVTMIGLRTFSDVLGVDNSHGIATTPRAYAVRHVGVALIGLVGLLAAAAIAGLVLRSRRWAVVCGAVLGALPLWTGHTMFNIKDIPVGTGITLLSLALAWMARARPRRWEHVVRPLVLAAGVTLAMGTRPGTWTAVTAALVGYAVLVLAARRLAPDDDRPPLTGLLEAAAGLAVAGGLLLAAYPNVFRTPFTALRRSAESSNRFRGAGGADRSYLPEHVLTDLPLVLVLLWLIGIGIGLLALARLRSRPVIAVQVAVVGIQALALPVLAVLAASDLYNGLRQLILVAPAGAVLATLGAASVCARLRRPVLRRGLIGIGVALGLVLPVADQLTLFPYGYAYASVGADAAGRDSQDDYWRTSVRELAAHIPDDAQVTCSPGVLGDGTAIRTTPDGSVDCRTSPVGPLLPSWRNAHRPVGFTAPDDEFYAVITRNAAVVPANCTLLHEVTRWRHGRTRVMSQVSRCTRDAPALPASGIRVTDNPAQASLFAVRGFDGGVIHRGLHARADNAAIAFSPGPACAEQGCSVILAASMDPDTVISVAGAALPFDRLGPRSLRIRIPVELARGSSQRGGIWLTFTRPGAAPLDLTFRGLAPEPVAPEPVA